MPFVDHGGVPIHYEVRGAGEPLVLLHGFTSSLRRWDQGGYAETLQRSHRLVLIDLRGHGRSGKPHDPAAYALEHRLGDIRAVLAALGIAHAHFFGYSMGGWLAFGMAARFPCWVKSLVVAGAHPYADSLAAFTGVDGTRPGAFIAALEDFLGERIGPEIRCLMLQNDLAALCAAARDRDGFAPELRHLDLPVLMLVGDRDRRHALVRRACRDVRGAQLVVVPEDNHIDLLYSSEALLPHIVRFLGRQGAHTR